MNAQQNRRISITRRRAWSIAEAATIYGVSRGFLLNRIKQGDLHARKVGRRVIILDSDLLAFFESERAK
jgi:excisionase family DNA binding protein